MKLGFSSNAYTRNSLTYAIHSISKVGYDGIEIVLDTPHAFLPLSNSILEKIKHELKLNSLNVTNLNCNTVVGYHNSQKNLKFEPSLSNSNLKLRKWRIGYIKKSIDTAVELGAPSICLTSGILSKRNFDQHMKNFQNSLEEISSYAEKYGILIGIEYEPGLLLNNSNDVFEFSKFSKNIGLNFDICHAEVMHENIPKIIKKFNKKIFHIHLSDCKNNRHFHLIPGLGTIDFNKIYSSLKKIHYKGYLTGELYTYNKCPNKVAIETFNYLKKLVK